MKITEDYWIYKYQPIFNESKDSYLIEISELDSSIDLKRVWTLIDCDGDMCIIPGRHYVNRMNYIVCEVPITDEDDNEWEVMYDEQYSKNEMINLCKTFVYELNQIEDEDEFNEIDEIIELFFGSV